jgi:hypothetical protein
LNLTTSFALARGEASGASGNYFGGRGTVTTIADWPRGVGYRIDEQSVDGGNTSPDTPKASGTTGYPPAPPTPDYGKYNP